MPDETFRICAFIPCEGFIGVPQDSKMKFHYFISVEFNIKTVYVFCQCVNLYFNIHIMFMFSVIILNLSMYLKYYGFV